MGRACRVLVSSTCSGDCDHCADLQPDLFFVYPARSGCGLVSGKRQQRHSRLLRQRASQPRWNLTLHAPLLSVPASLDLVCRGGSAVGMRALELALVALGGGRRIRNLPGIADSGNGKTRQGLLVTISEADVGASSSGGEDI